MSKFRVLSRVHHDGKPYDADAIVTIEDPEQAQSLLGVKAIEAVDAAADAKAKAEAAEKTKAEAEKAAAAKAAAAQAKTAAKAAAKAKAGK